MNDRTGFTRVPCANCRGTGREPSPLLTSAMCYRCIGTGYVYRYHRDMPTKGRV